MIVAYQRPCTAVILGLLLLALLVPAFAEAHPLAPALLELKENPEGGVEVLWKRSSLSVPGSNVQPVVPEACAIRSQPRFEKQGVAVLMRWTLDCGEQGLVGRPIRIDGLGPAKIDTLVRIHLADGRLVQRVLRRSEPSMIVPAKAKRLAVFQDYLSIGFEHILSGADHLLFVFGLFMICLNSRALIKTISAFTVGHSGTLTLAALGITNVPTGPVEVLIAGSVLVLAVELARDEPKKSWMRRFPWPMALVFGLLHGMGFAGALSDIGLPNGEIPMALLSFNIGIELGQLGFVVLLGILALAARRTKLSIPTRLPIYAMGSLAAYWVIDRSVNLIQ
ncbi:MAG: HupE/UreJ family protein [Myxococcota bacterium]